VKVLWFTNIPMPEAAAHLGLPKMLGGHWMWALLSELKERRELELGVVTVHPGVKTCRLSASGIEYYVIGQPRFQSFFACSPEHIRSCVDIVNSFCPDVIHVHGSERFYGLIGARSLVQPPVLISIQGILRPYDTEFFGALGLRDLWRAEKLKEVLTYRGLMWSYQKQRSGVVQEAEILGGATAVAGRTKWDEAWAQVLAPQARYFHIDEVLRPAFCESDWQPELCEEHSIIFTNTGAPRRGTEILLSALRILKPDFPKARLRLAGSSGRRFGRLSGYDRFVHDRIADLGLGDSVEWLGQLDSDAMAKALTRSHIFAICSSVENSPNSLCEAMSMGVPCVASYAGGIPSLMEDERTGLLFPKGDAAMLAANIRRLFNDRNLCVRLGTAAKLAARTRHAPERVVGQTMNAYRALTGNAVGFRAAVQEAEGVLSHTANQ
jgi:glycosyltransferase involved in cell wall biosynthesis